MKLTVGTLKQVDYVLFLQIRLHIASQRFPGQAWIHYGAGRQLQGSVRGV